MAGITLNDFKANVQELARPNRFLLTIPTPPLGVPEFSFGDEMIYHVKAASLPGRTVGEIVVPWQGIQYKIAGDPTYDDYSITFINNVSFDIKKIMEEWTNFVTNTITNERASHADYKGVIQLDQLGRGDNIIATYYIHGAWPKSLDAVDMSMESSDAIEEFVVNFSMDYWSNDSTPGVGAAVVLQGDPA